MRFVSFRWLHSLAAKLLCTYVAALMLTMCFIAFPLWFSFNQDVSVANQAQLGRTADLIRRSLRFDSAGLPAVVVFPPDLSWVSWVYHDFPADLKYRVLDVSGGVVLSSDHDAVALAPSGQPFDSTLGSFTLISGGVPMHVRTEPMVHGTKTYYIQVAITERLGTLARSLISHLVVNDMLRFALASVVLFTIAVYFTLRRVLTPLRETGRRRGTSYSGRSLPARPMN